MTLDNHYRRLERMYDRAVVNRLYEPRLKASDGEVEITMPVQEKFFHSAGAIHGSVYFKILDDAACFAAWTREKEFFIVTAAFTTYITRPVMEGKLRAVGRVTSETKTQFIVESTAFDRADRIVAQGNGIMMRGRAKLADLDHYTAD